MCGLRLRARIGVSNVRTYLGGALHEELYLAPRWLGLEQGGNETAGRDFTRVPHPGISDVVEETLRGSPAQMFIYVRLTRLVAFS
jgi:hypothetical protein